MESIPSASYSVTLRIEFPHEAGSLGRILTTVGDAGGMVGAVDIVRMGEKRSTRDITVNARDSEHGERVVKAVEELPGVRVVNVSDRTFLVHLGGKIEVQSKMPVRTRDDLSMVYTPGLPGYAERSPRTPKGPSTSPSSATPWRSSPTAPLSWGSET
jgi:malate dehydrogenase (oxaloacetate-decarboxylating)